MLKNYNKDGQKLPLFGIGPYMIFGMGLVTLTGKTDIPRWGCVFNTLPAFLILMSTKIPAKGNIANAFMFLGLALCMIW